MATQLHPNKIRQFLWIAIIVMMGIVIVKEMYFMLGAFLGAITFYVVFRHWMILLVVQYRWKKWLAALLMIFVSLAIIILPIAWITSVGLDRLQPFIQNPTYLNQVSEKIHNYLLQEYNLDIITKEQVSKVNKMLTDLGRKGLESIFSVLGNLVIMYLLLYFMFIRSTDIEHWLRNSIPLKKQNAKKVISEIRNMVYSNAIGIPLVALVQGFTGFIGYMLFGVKEFVLMGFLTAVTSVIPVVGAMAVYVPLAIYELANGRTWQGVAIALWGFILIGSIDNVARFLLQKKLANVHPLITIFGVLIGINLVGFLGIIFGPLLLSLFILIVRIYFDEFGNIDSVETKLQPTSTSTDEQTNS
jgi:Predicted permease